MGKMRTKAFVAAAAVTTLLSAGVFAAGEDVATQGHGYVSDQWGGIVRSGAGLCWRTGSWTPARALRECDPDLFKMKVLKHGKVSLVAETLFAFDSAALTEDGKAVLRNMVSKAKSENAEIKGAKVYGHTDRIGAARYNQTLSEKRAAAVANFISETAGSISVMEVRGYGKTMPVTQKGQCSKMSSKDLKACLAPDRRVDVELMGEVTTEEEVDAK